MTAAPKTQHSSAKDGISDVTNSVLVVDLDALGACHCEIGVKSIDR